MSRSHLSQAVLTTRNVVLGIATFLGMRTMYGYVKDMIVHDPFAALRAEGRTGLADSIGIHLENVKVNAYRNGELVTSAVADRIDVDRQDRQLFTLSGIHDGVFVEDKHRYGYSANSAIWQSNSRQLSMNGSVRLQDADLDLRTDAVIFNGVLHTLSTPEPISGRLYHGTLVAKGFKMDTATRAYETGNVDYRGTLAMMKQSDEDQTSKLWHFYGDASKFVPSKGGSPAVTYFVNGKAQDDEVILKADLVARYKDTDVAVATGNVKYFSAKADISADRATIYQREKRVVLVGHVTIYVKPKSEDGKPPVEETMPLFARTKPEEMVADNAGPKSSTAGVAGAAAAVPAAGIGGAPPTSVPPKQPSTGTASGATSTSTPAPSTPAPTTPSNPTTPTVSPQVQPATTGGSPAPVTKAGTPPSSTSTPGGQAKTTPPKPKTDTGAKQKPGGAEDKQLDEDLRSGKSVRKYPMVILCDHVEYWYRKGQRHAHIEGMPQGKQELPKSRWRDVWSTTADYDGERDELTLLSTPGKIDVRMKNSKGDDLTALTLIVSTKEDADEEQYWGGKKVSGVGWVESGSDTTTNQKNAGPLTGRQPITGPPIGQGHTGTSPSGGG